MVFEMKLWKLFNFLLFIPLFIGCDSDTTFETAEKNEIAFSPIVCTYSVMPTCWTPIDCITLNVQVNNDNTVDVFCSDFSDYIGSEEVNLDYIYGETFEISEDQKQNIITEIKENKINELENCGDENSCDGSYRYIYLCDADGESVHSCGGLNPHNNRFEKTVESILSVLPENTTKDIRSKSEEIIGNLMSEK